MKEKQEEFYMEKIVDLLKRGEDDGTFLGSIYSLYLLIGVAKGLDDARNGKGITIEEFDKEMEARHESDRRRFG